MKLKITLEDTPCHGDFATCVAWNSVDEVLSCGDDHVLLQWNIMSNEVTRLVQLPPDLFPTSMTWPPKGSSAAPTAGTRKVNDLLLLTTTDGHFHLISRAGRIEKSVQAHKGAVLSGSWNQDGSEILTSGEDGTVRVWSRGGMLRTTLSQTPVPIYSSCWSPDGGSALFTSGTHLVLKPLKQSTKQIQWRAHDGIILTTAWSSSHGMIISGGEDCKYKVWDSEGRPIFSSSTHDHPVTSLAWTRGGEYFVVGGFNSLRLCDRFGWSHCLEKPPTGSIYALSWSSDGTGFVGAGSSGRVFLANVVDKGLTWRTTEAVLVGSKAINVTEFTTNNKETLEIRDRILKISMGFGYIIAITPSQVYIYSLKNLNTPVISELRENNSISLILQSNWQFALVGGLFISVWTYDGRQIGAIKWSGMRADLINESTGSMGPDLLAFRDSTDLRLIRVFEAVNGKPVNEFRLNQEVRSISLAKNDYSGMTERLLAILDKNQDLYLAMVKKYGAQGPPKKLTSMTQSMAWHDEAPILAIVQEGRLVIHYLPQILFLDPTLVDFTFEEKELGDLGRYPEIISYESNKISIRRADGVLFVTSGSTIVPHLHEHAIKGKFNEAKRICRYVNDKLLWGVMAGLSTWKNELSLMEICYSEISQNEKVYFINELKEHTPDPSEMKAQLTLICQGAGETESILVQQGKIGEAIQTQVNSHNWDRALDLAMKHKQGLDMVLGARKFYLHLINQEESMPRFIELRNLTFMNPEGSTSAPRRRKKSKKKVVEVEEEATEEPTSFNKSFATHEVHEVNEESE